MNKFILLLIGVFCCTTALQAAGDEFVPLFNARDLDGWVNVNCAPETWTVREGTIICTGIPTGVLRTEKQYENYVLELEWRHMKKRGNAGLFIHSDPVTAVGQPFTRSIEIQIMDGNAGDMFSIHGATMTPDKPHPKGWVRSFPSEDRMNPTGQWNHYRVESRNGTASLAVNGKIVTRGYHLNPRKGYICLESEGSEIHFRNIRIRELLGCDVYSPCSIEEHHPDLYWYGVHGVEMLFTVMGTGCKNVRRVQTPGSEFVVGIWNDGRIGTYRGLKTGKSSYGITIFGSKSIIEGGKDGGYEPLVYEIIQFFKTGKVPVPQEETIEIFAFMSAADESKAKGGAAVSIAETIEKAQKQGRVR